MPEDSSTPDWFEVPIRVRYCETDAMGLLHHANYLNYFEQARTELFRAEGGSYRYMEERGFYFVIVKVEVDYKRPGRFDDDLRVLIRVSKRTAAKIEHEYEVYFGQLLMNKARTIVACVDRQGQVQRITDDIMYGDRGIELAAVEFTAEIADSPQKCPESHGVYHITLTCSRSQT